MDKEKDEVVEVKTKKQLYDEAQQAKREARRKKEEKELRKARKAELKKQYRNPASTTWGKILIWILMLSMVAAFIITLIYLIIQNVK
jgi:preprotein translocase subunit SecF